MGASWGVLKEDKEILIFPIISRTCCLLVLASFAVPIFLTESWEPPSGEIEAIQQVAYYGTIFLFYFCNYFVITFFNAAMIACATIRLNGGDPTVAGFFFFMARGPDANLLLGVLGGLGNLYFLLLSLIQTALQAIFQAALFLYAPKGKAPADFDSRALRDALAKR